MTTNTRIQPLLDVITAATDVVEHDGELDIFELILSLKALIPAPDFEALALSFDVCPIHDQDLDSCADEFLLDQLDLTDRGRRIPLTACRHLRPAH